MGTQLAANALSLLKSKWFWITVAVVILAFVLYKNGKRWWEQLFKTDRGDYSGESLNDARKAELKLLADQLHSVIEGYVITGGDREGTMQQLYTLNDTELRWTAIYYKDIAGESMFDAVDGEWMPLTTIDDRLCARLREQNLA